jgi:hypothetical protein
MKKFLFIFTIFVFCMGMCCFNNYPDNDLWARLIAGQYIVEKLSILKYDFLSYTPTHPWYDHEWGASVFFYLALKYFGDNGLILLKGILSAFTVFMCFKTVELNKPKSTTPYNILYFAIMFIAVSKSLGPDIRCLLFTCLFFAISLYILEKSRLGKKKNLIFLPFLMILWGNIHGGCISGIGLLGIYTVGEFLNKKSFKEYIFTAIGCVIALFINPYGIEYVKFLFFAATMQREFISEWTSSFHPKFIHQYMQYKIYLIVMLLTQIVYLIKNRINYEKMDKTKILLIFTLAFLSITHIRHQTFFVYTVGTLLYDEFYSLFNEFVSFVKNKLKIENKTVEENFIIAKEVIVYFLLLIMTLPMVISKNKEIRITETQYPRYAIEFIKINNLKGNLFINFDWGSYAAYKLFPNNLIVMDGRYEEVYAPELLLELKDFHLLKNDWYKIIRNYKTDVMILEKKYPVYNAILNNKDWQLVFDNNLSGVFVPTSTVKDNYLYPVVDDNYYNKEKFQTNIKFK